MLYPEDDVLSMANLATGFGEYGEGVASNASEVSSHSLGMVLKIDLLEPSFVRPWPA